MRLQTYPPQKGHTDNEGLGRGRFSRGYASTVGPKGPVPVFSL